MNTFELIIVISAGVLTIFNLMDKLVGYAKKVKEPTDSLSERVSTIEKRMEIEYKALFADYELRFRRDLNRIEAIEEGNRTTQKAILALLTHSIDGNNIEEMKKAKKALEEYLINK